MVKAPEIYVATAGAFITYAGRSVQIRQGRTFLRSDHPVVKDNPHLFAPLSLSDIGGDAEQATAAPGEKRSVTPVAEQGDDADPDAS